MGKRTPHLGEVMTQYLDFQRARGRSKATISQDVMVINKFIRHVGDIQIANVTQAHVQDFFYGPKGQRSEHAVVGNGVKVRQAVGPATHNHYRSRLKVFFTYAYEEGYTRTNNLLSRIDPMKVPARRPEQPAPQILLALLDKADNTRDRAFIAMAINTGLRASEIVAIRVGDLDLESGYVYVTITKTKDEDAQPISSDLDAEIRRWWLTYETDLGRPLTADDYLFPARRGGLITGYTEDREPVREALHWIPGKPMTGPEKAVQKALKALDRPTRFEGVHTIRRAVALAYFEMVSKEQGDVAALRETAALLHHKNLATTERYLGMTAEKNRRNRRIKGKPFLTAMVPQENVVRGNFPRAGGE